jgi:riboflavin transporter FmnP
MNEDLNPTGNTPPDTTGGKAASGTAPTDAAAQTTPENKKQPSPAQEVGPFPLVIGFLFWVVVILWWVWKNSETARRFLQDWWWAVGAGTCLAVIIFCVVGPLRRWFAKAAAEKRTGVVVFAVLPALLVAIGTIVLLKRGLQSPL